MPNEKPQYWLWLSLKVIQLNVLLFAAVYIWQSSTQLALGYHGMQACVKDETTDADVTI